jgi:hypothetical protein
MTSTSTCTTPSIAFFGATGGCAHSSLVHTLKAGYNVSALARTPSKLTSQLLADGVTQETLDRQLLIVEGNSKDISAVKRTLCPDENGSIVSKIVSGIGGTVKMTYNPFRPISLTDPTICEQSAITLIQALKELQSTHKGAAKPLITFVSTTGVARSGKRRDVPIAFLFLYHYLLAVPHIDKRKLEELISQNVAETDENQRVFRDFVGIRASLLLGGITSQGGKGLNKVRAGTENKPAVGYTITRADVGEWIFENIIHKNGEGWLGEFVTLTN